MLRSARFPPLWLSSTAPSRMLDKYRCLEKLAARRSDEVVVSTMSVATPWARLSDGPLDFASVESAMGHAADFACGLAMAQPNRRIIVLNGDGSTLMCLGTLVTIAQLAPSNLTVVITENGTYEVTGSQQVPGADQVDYELLCRGAGLDRVQTLTEEPSFDAALEDHFVGPGPRVFVWQIAPSDEPVPMPSLPIVQRAQRLRRALLGTA